MHDTDCVEMKKEILYQEIARSIAWKIQKGVWKVGDDVSAHVDFDITNVLAEHGANFLFFHTFAFLFTDNKDDFKYKYRERAVV